MSRTLATLCGVGLGLVLSIMSAPVAAETIALTPLQCGDEEREYAGGTCRQESAFLAGIHSPAPHLKVGGEGAAVSVPRSTLTPETALDIVYPSAANTDLSFDVTAAVRDWVAAGAHRAGVLLASVYSEAGYEDWISVGGAGHTFPPRLIVMHEGTIGTVKTGWADVKSSYR